MADNKKYYYLKLKETFFDSEEMKLFESMKNGTEYQNLYLKLCLLSIKYGGKLIFKNILPYDLNMLSTILRINIDTVKTGIEIFAKFKLIEILENGVMFMTDIQALIGHGSSEAERKAKYRESIDYDKKSIADKSGTLSPNFPPEREREIELEKEIDIELKKEKEDTPPLESLVTIFYKQMETRVKTICYAKSDEYKKADVFLSRARNEADKKQLRQNIIKAIPVYFDNPGWWNTIGKKGKEIDQSCYSFSHFLGVVQQIIVLNNKQELKKDYSGFGDKELSAEEI